MARMSVDLPAPERPTMTSIWPSGISRRQVAQRMHAARIGDRGVLEADHGRQDMRAGGPMEDPLRLATATTAVAELLDGLADDVEGLEVRLGEGGDVVDRVEHRRALLGRGVSRAAPA